VIIPGNQNCDIRNIHWLEPEASFSEGQDSEEANPLYYKTSSGAFKKRRLITTGLNGHVIEWNLQTAIPKSKYNSHAAIWDSKMFGKYIYLASEDGTIKILKAKKTKIDFVRTLPKGEDKCLSVELITDNKSDPKSIVRSLYAGYADSSIRRWDLITGNSVLHF